MQNSFEVGPDAVDINDLYCMTMNIYHESRGEPVQGQLAVGNVVINRVDSPDFPNTYCGVILQDKQFSWYWDGKSDRIRNMEDFKLAAELSFMLLIGYIEDNTEGALYYYNPSVVNPYWATAYNYKVTHANHVFLQ